MALPDFGWAGSVAGSVCVLFSFDSAGCFAFIPAIAVRAAIPDRIALAAGAASAAFVAAGTEAAESASIGVSTTSRESPVRMGLVKSARTPLTRIAKVTRLVAGGGVNPTASSASLTLAVPVPF